MKGKQCEGCGYKDEGYIHTPCSKCSKNHEDHFITPEDLEKQKAEEKKAVIEKVNELLYNQRCPWCGNSVKRGFKHYFDMHSRNGEREIVEFSCSECVMPLNRVSFTKDGDTLDNIEIIRRRYEER
jgi:hypothetical protein